MLSSLGFAYPSLLLALLILPLIWWLLRLTPPKPVQEFFPPIKILKDLETQNETPASSPWWLLLLRLLLAALFILALAEPIWNPAKEHLSGKGRVLLLIDNSWAASRFWDKRIETAQVILDEAQNAGRPVSIAVTVNEGAIDLTAGSALDAQKHLAAFQPYPIAADFETLSTAIEKDTQASPSTVIYLGSGLQHLDHQRLISALEKYQTDEKLLYQTSITDLNIIADVENTSEALLVTLKRAKDKAFAEGAVLAYDQQGRILSETPFEFDEGDSAAIAKFNLPVELRNEVARLSIKGKGNAGATFLIDGRFQRKRVGLISGEKNDLAQPLLSPLYYIARALSPFSDLIEPDNANLAEAIPNVMAQKPSMIVLADIGTMPQKPRRELEEWVREGGTLVRFAGQNLAAAEDDHVLLPVKLRKGERQLSGSLTWGKPQALAKFNKNSPFGNLALPEDVSVTRQVLAEPDLNLEDQTWVSLEDGTPLVTAKTLGRGRVILFHVTADVSWSNLPLSGTFVEMLRSITVSSQAALLGNADKSDRIIQPFKMLDAQGNLSSPAAYVKPLKPFEDKGFEGGKTSLDTLDNPPGLYGTNDAFVARNLFSPKIELSQASDDFTSAFTSTRSLIKQSSISLKPWLLMLATGLFLLDCLVMIMFQGAFKWGRFTKGALGKGSAALVLIAALVFGAQFMGVDAKAQNASSIASTKEEITLEDFKGALKTRIAYVITNNLRLDDISHQGLIGLTDALTERSALEPGDPIGVNLAEDELSFYPLIYWPIDPKGEVPSAKTMARVDAYMKQGGTVLFDTRDALSQNGINGTSPEKLMLKKILSSLDIPPLAPVTKNHVLTRTFYLLDRFPGLYRDGQLWVEALPDQKNSNKQITRVGDGVSSIMITSNDFASAWAVDETGRFMFPTVPPSKEQRSYAFRTGINIIMYTLTGNYKADQVHIPALLERLGQ